MNILSGENPPSECTRTVATGRRPRASVASFPYGMLIKYILNFMVWIWSDLLSLSMESKKILVSWEKVFKITVRITPWNFVFFDNLHDGFYGLGGKRTIFELPLIF